jgi:hypothetical protein
MTNSGFTDWYQDAGNSKPSCEPDTFSSFEPKAWAVDAPW